VAASAYGARVIATGEPAADDPQHAFGAAANGFPPVPSVRGVADGETLRVGPLAIAARLTPGHTPGSTSWTWRSCEGKRCLDVVYADSLSAVSAPGYRFSGLGDGGRYVDAFRRGIATVAALPCDVLLTPHPSAFGMDEKLRRRGADRGANAFVDPNSCRAYADNAARVLDRRLAEESGAARVR
jgi:metallo-beta-lactamase class B